MRDIQVDGGFILDCGAPNSCRFKSIVKFQVSRSYMLFGPQRGECGSLSTCEKALPVRSPSGPDPRRWRGMQSAANSAENILHEVGSQSGKCK